MIKKNKINIALIGYGNWGKKIYKNLKKISLINLEVYTKKSVNMEKNFKIINKITNLNLNKFDGIVCATNAKVHEKIAVLCIKNNTPVFIEKPISKDFNFFKEPIIKSKKKKLLIVNYIYLKYLIYKKFLPNFKKTKKVILIFGSTNGKKDFRIIKWEWLTHIFAIVVFFFGENIRNLKIKKKIQ